MADQRPKSVQSGFRSKSQPSLSVKTGYSGKSSGSIAGSGKPTAPKPKPEWDSNTQQNPAEHRETEEERLQRATSHVSKNLKVAQRELEEKKIRNDIKHPGAPAKVSFKQGPVVKEVILSLDEIAGMIDESNRVLDEARQLLREHERSYHISAQSRPLNA